MLSNEENIDDKNPEEFPRKSEDREDWMATVSDFHFRNLKQGHLAVMAM